MRLLVSLALVGAASISPALAQELPRTLSSLRYVPAQDRVAPRIIDIEVGDSTYPRTYWLEGALIVGVPFALLGALFAGHGCSDPDSGAGEGPCWDNVLLGVVVGFGTGASLGGLIGGQFKKKARQKADHPIEPEAQDSVESAR